jgi:hypothetical protein
MVYRDSNGRTFKKRATRGIILGVPEETKGYVVYLKEDQKVVNTQHVKQIETLSNAQNTALLSPSPSTEETSNARNGGAVTPENQPGNKATDYEDATRQRMAKRSRPRTGHLAQQLHLVGRRQARILKTAPLQVGIQDKA